MIIWNIGYLHAVNCIVQSDNSDCAQRWACVCVFTCLHNGQVRTYWYPIIRSSPDKREVSSCPQPEENTCRKYFFPHVFIYCSVMSFENSVSLPKSRYALSSSLSEENFSIYIWSLNNIGKPLLTSTLKIIKTKPDRLVNSIQKHQYQPSTLRSVDMRARLRCSSARSDSPVQCCLIPMPQGNTVKKLTAHRKTPGGK